MVLLFVACTSPSATSIDTPTTSSGSSITTTANTAATTATATTATTATTSPGSIISTTTTNSVPATQPVGVDPATPCGAPVAAPHTYDHVIWIWMENKDSSIVGSAKAPFMTGLADQCGVATNYRDHGVHPSLPNYILATSGDTQGINDDRAPKAHPLTANNIFRQVRASGRTAKSYVESMDGNCDLSGHGDYAVRHNPAAYYVGADDRAACDRDSVAFDVLTHDLESSTLPAFVSITPNLCHDMHDCSVGQGDQWLLQMMSTITSSETYRGGRTAVFIVWDESAGRGTMPFIAVAPSVPAGTVVDAELGHAALLAFTEDALGIAEHLGEAAHAPGLGAAFGL
jgi:hypothetical protein